MNNGEREKTEHYAFYGKNWCLKSIWLASEYLFPIGKLRLMMQSLWNINGYNNDPKKKNQPL